VNSGQPTVSVIIPNYNYEKTLALCLASVYAQTYPVHEVIVVDDASTDRSVEICQGFPCTVIRRPANGGVSVARNVGVAASTGTILFFLDSDTALTEDSIANGVRLLLEDDRCGLVHGLIAAEPLIDDGPVEWYRTIHAQHWRRRSVGLVPTAYFAVAAMRRTAFDDTGPFDEALRDSEDVEYSERLSRRYRIRMTDEIVGRHDEADRLIPMLREQYRRAEHLLAFAAKHRMRDGAPSPNRLGGLLAAPLVLATLPLVLWSPALLVAPLLFLVLFVAADPGLHRFAVQTKGPVFGVYFLVVHFLVQLFIVLGAAIGGLRWWTNPTGSYFGPDRNQGDHRW
jgi:GT2 family glycosyltransferase